MQFDEIGVVLRPRLPAETWDLGLAILRRWWRAFFGAWLFTGLPLACFLYVVTPNVAWYFLALVLAEPALERVGLLVASRAIFGATPRPGEVLRALPRLWTRAFLGGFVLRRFSPVRTLVAPVAQLEDLRGREAAARARLLAGRVGGAQMGFAFGLRFINLGLWFGAVALVMLFYPSALDDVWVALTGDETGMTPPPVWLRVVLHLALTFLHAVCTTYAGIAGFALYLQRRTELEGWDIEVTFRSLGRRLGDELRSAWRGAGLVLVIGALLVSLATPAPAAPLQDRAAVKEKALEVLSDPDFETKEQRTEWRLPFEGSGGAPGPAAALFPVLEVLFWAAAIGVGAWALYRIALTLGWIERPKSAVAPQAAVTTEVLGLDLRPESLPDDVAAATLALWRRGEHAAAIGLLYRATLARLVERFGVELSSSDTESDCLRRASARLDAATLGVTRRVTDAWLVTAYARTVPLDAVVEALCSEWPTLFDRAVGPTAVRPSPGGRP